MALLLAISLLGLMTVLTTEIVHQSGVRIRMAANQRDEAKAEALAFGGIQFYRLILMVSRRLDRQASAVLSQMGSQALGIPVNQLWQIVPRLSTSLLRIVFVSDGNEREMKQLADGNATDLNAASREESSRLKKAFLDFDGDFTVTCEDENSRIYVGNAEINTLATIQDDPRLSVLHGMMISESSYDFLRSIDLTWEELLGALIDWTDPDDNRADRGGRESVVYQRLEDPYLPKNAPFESVDEIRLVDGWHRDDVWKRFGERLTVYGNGQINVNTADRRVMEALVNAHVYPRPGDVMMDRFWETIIALRTLPSTEGGRMLNDADQFVSILQAIFAGSQVDPDRLKRAITTKSTVFRLRSEGKVGDATAEIEAVFDFTKNEAGQVVYWRVR